ncbi:MAG TPA: PDZ domain-containing protein [Steroidobacteraceae bacterium]|nr:PDZ domain-containing protein [Steroidobacteraceae bacterium]
MRIHITSHATALAVCLSLAAAAAFAGEGAAAPAVPPAPAAPPAAVDSTAVPSPADADEAALQANMDAARTSEEAARASEKAAARSDAELQARMDAARHRLEVAAQQLAALSAQMSGPMMRFDAFGGPPRALIGLQLGDSRGQPGARVREVSPGGPAEQAGVRAGDLIVAVNGTDVRGQGSAGHVVELLHDVKPGDRVDLRVSRGGKTRDLRVTARPDGNAFFVGRQFPDLPPLALPQVRALAQWGGAPMIIGGPVADMELARLTPGLGRYFGADTGVLVVRAPRGGALGLQDGDVILSIGGRKPTDSSHVIRILASYDPGEKITLEVLRLHRKISVATTAPAEPPMPRHSFMMQKGGMLGPGPVVPVTTDGGTP